MLAAATAIIAISIYVYGMYFAPICLHVALTCLENSTQPTWCYEHSFQMNFILDGSPVVEQSPKLKEGLSKALTAEPVYGEREYVVNMSMAEFDSMSRLLVNTNQTQTLQGYAHRETPTLSLFPKNNSSVFLNYNGSSYQLIPKYPVVAPFGQWRT